RVEALRGCLGEPLHLARDDALQLLDLPALDVAKRRLDAHRRLAALAVDRVLQLTLAAPDPLGDLLQRAPALGRVLLQVGVRLFDDACRRANELLPLARDLLPLLLDL